MPRGVKGSGPYAGRGKKKSNGGARKRTTSLADIAARGPNASHQQASAGVTSGSAAATATGRGRGAGRATANKTTARRGRGATANNGQQRADAPMTGATGTSGSNDNGGNNGATNMTDVNGVKIEVVAIPGRGGRPQQSEAFPFAMLDVATKGEGGEMVGPSFLIPEDKNPDNVLAAARKRHKGKTFTARKMEGGVRIWRVS